MQLNYNFKNCKAVIEDPACWYVGSQEIQSAKLKK